MSCIAHAGLVTDSRSTAYPSFGSLFPLPDQTSGDHNFISPRPEYAVDQSVNGTPFRGIRTRQCLLADDGKQRDFFFADDGLALDHRWRKVNAILPMPDICPDGSVQHGGRPQPELEAPFLRIRHSLKIRIVVHSPGSDAESVIILTTPIRFASAPTTLPGRSSTATRLPAYIQVFHENGDVRQCDPLPVYTARAQDAGPAPEGETLPPVPPYKSLFPEDSTFLRVPSPSTSIESLRSTSLSGSSSSGAADAIDMDPRRSSPSFAGSATKSYIVRPTLEDRVGA